MKLLIMVILHLKEIHENQISLWREFFNLKMRK